MTTSSVIVSGLRSGSCSSWVRLWSQSRLPAATTCLTSDSCAAALFSIMQNVATAPWRCRTASTCGVHRGSGPSSKVSATVRASASRLRTSARGTTGPGATSSTCTGGGGGGAGAMAGTTTAACGAIGGIGSSGATSPNASTAR